MTLIFMQIALLHLGHLNLLHRQRPRLDRQHRDHVLIQTPSASAVIELPDPDEQPAPPDDTSIIDNPVEAVVEVEPVGLVYHEWMWRKGYNLVSFPVMREGIETVADLYQAYTLFKALQGIIYVVIDGCWFAYNGQEGQIAGEVQITPYLGVVMVNGLDNDLGDARR